MPTGFIDDITTFFDNYGWCIVSFFLGVLLVLILWMRSDARDAEEETQEPQEEEEESR